MAGGPGSGPNGLGPPASRTAPIRIVIVENHQLVSESLGLLLDSQADMQVVAQVSSVHDAARVPQQVDPDVVMMDFHLDDGTGRDATIAMRQTHPRARFIFLSRDMNDIAQLAAIEVGASAYLSKSAPASDVIAAVRRVAGGDSLITPSQIASTLRRNKDRLGIRNSLSPRERDVLQLMSDGVSTRGMTQKLGISYSTVRSHIRSINAKLGAHTMLNAVVAARELELVT